MALRSTRSHAQPVSDVFLDFTGSVHFDQRLYRYDAAGSIAHAHTLERAGVLTQKERKAIVSSLKGIAHEIGKGKAILRPGLEDIHMNIERLLVEDVGAAIGGKLHTGRSRNDQVALDMRLMVREELTHVIAEISAMENVLLRRAREAKGGVLPGYTHMQHAQPVLLAHHLLAHFWRLQRDLERLADCYQRTNQSPLGSGALAGTTFALDRKIAANMLRMDRVTHNSLDAVSDRDFCAESAFALSLLMIHLSSMCEELVLWSSKEFGFIALPERLSSGSSMMPQKRNPDIPELVRGKCGRTVGGLVAILTLLKSLPLAYNRDLQEDKENLFDIFDTVGSSLRALTSFLDEIDFDRVRMRKSAEVGLMTATDLADFLTTKGMDFRRAHGVVGEIARQSKGDDVAFRELAGAFLRNQLNDYTISDMNFLSIDKAVDRRKVEGGTSKSAVSAQMAKAGSVLTMNNARIERMMHQVSAVGELLH
jgi:argininosuccinate lyase